MHKKSIRILIEESHKKYDQQRFIRPLERNSWWEVLWVTLIFSMLFGFLLKALFILGVFWR